MRWLILILTFAKSRISSLRNREQLAFVPGHVAAHHFGGPAPSDNGPPRRLAHVSAQTGIRE